MLAEAAAAAALGGPPHPHDNRSRVRQACAHCKAAKTRCDNSRPCRRCVRTGREGSCINGSSVHTAWLPLPAAAAPLVASPSWPPSFMGLMPPHQHHQQQRSSFHQVLALLLRRNLEEYSQRRFPFDRENGKHAVFNWIATLLESLAASNLAPAPASAASANEAHDDSPNPSSTPSPSSQDTPRSTETDSLPSPTSDQAPDSFSSRQAFWRTLPLGVLNIDATQLLTRPSASVWINRHMSQSLGYEEGSLLSLLGSRTQPLLAGVEMVFSAANLPNLLDRLFHAILHRQAHICLAAQWVRRDGSPVVMSHSISIEYEEASGIPRSFTSFALVALEALALAGLSASSVAAPSPWQGPYATISPPLGEVIMPCTAVGLPTFSLPPASISMQVAAYPQGATATLHSSPGTTTNRFTRTAEGHMKRKGDAIERMQSAESLLELVRRGSPEGKPNDGRTGAGE